MDQLGGVISRKKLTKSSTNLQQDHQELQNNFDTPSTTTTKDDCTSNDFMGSFSSLPAPDLFRDEQTHSNDQGLQKAWSSIQSLENRLCSNKTNDLPNDATKVTDSDADNVHMNAGIGIEGLGFKPKSQESQDKPELSEVQKAFWNRKNRFMLPFMRRLMRKKRMKNDLTEKDGQSPYKFGAVVNLATMAAGMSSLPIVYSMNISDSSENETAKEDDIAEEDTFKPIYDDNEHENDEDEKKKTNLEDFSSLLDFEDVEDEIIKKFEHDMKGLAQLKRNKKSPNILMTDETIEVNNDDNGIDNIDRINATENVDAFAELLEQKLKKVANEEIIEEFSEKSVKMKKSALVRPRRSRSRIKESSHDDQGYDEDAKTKTASKEKVELVVNDQIVVLNSNKETWL